MNIGGMNMGGMSMGSVPDMDEVQALFSRRAGEYQHILEDATARMLTGSYRSEDLIEDYFAWWGRAARDWTAMTALAFGQFSGATEQPTTEADDGRSTPTNR